MNESQPSLEHEGCCPVCFKQLFKVSGSLDSCDHQFCLDCIFTWADVSNICPIDRKTFSTIIILNEKKDIISQASVKTKIVEVTEELYDFSSFCEVCTDEKEGTLLLCDTCDLAYHMVCLDPPLTKIPVGQWICPNCIPLLKSGKTRGRKRKGRKRRGWNQLKSSLEKSYSYQESSLPMPDFRPKVQQLQTVQSCESQTSNDDASSSKTCDSQLSWYRKNPNARVTSSLTSDSEEEAFINESKPICKIEPCTSPCPYSCTNSSTSENVTSALEQDYKKSDGCSSSSSSSFQRCSIDLDKMKIKISGDGTFMFDGL